MEDHRANDIKIMEILGRIDERTLSSAEDIKELKDAVKIQNGRVRSLESSRDTQKGEAKVHGWIAGIASSVVATVLITIFGIKK